MPRYEASPQVYEVARDFRVRCLEQDGSLLWNRFGVWTIDNLNLVRERFLDAPDMSGRDFWSKLKEQFAGLPEECFMILSDALMIYSLPSANMRKETKASFLDRVHGIGGPGPPELDEKTVQALGQGFIQTTYRYHAKYMQIWLLIRFALSLKERSAQRTLADPWDTARFLDDCLFSFSPTDRAYEMRHAILHLLFPDVFESVISTEDKQQIVDSFLTSTEVETIRAQFPSEAHPLAAIDRLLLEVRKRLRLEYAGSEPDFYSSGLKERWCKRARKKTDPAGTMGEPFSTLFADRDEAVWAFEFMGRVIAGLGLGDADDPRLVMSLPRDGRAFHLSFCNWLVIGISASARESERFYVLLLERTATSLIGRQPSYRFKQREGEPKLNCYTFSIEEARRLGDRLLHGVEEALPVLRQRFSSYEVSPFKRFHLRVLQQAALDAAYRERLLDEGLSEEEPAEQVPPKYWVFQIDPSIYRIVDSLRDEKLRTIPVMAHAEDIKKGDKAVIWVKGAEPPCFALVTVCSDPYLGHADEEESRYYVDSERALEETIRCEVSVDSILVERPVLKAEMMESPPLRDLPAGSEELVLAATAEQYEKLRRLAGALAPTGRPQPLHTNPEYALAQISVKTGFAEDDLARWVRAIDRKGQAVFYGPPGTGKTLIATELARHMIGGTDGFSEIIQFHPAYSYEDFIQGIRVKTSEDGRLLYPMEPGRFLQFCAEAQRRTGRCVLVIDEINRANLSRVFGELMYLLEYRDREVPLAGDGRSFKIPANVRIIGTMNTADRSIALVDHALRRRFAFIPLRPRLEILRKHHAGTGVPVENLIKVLSRLNAQIGDPNFEVGISFFMQEDLAQALRDIWEMEIEPYLEEYFFDQPGIVDEFRWAKVEGEIFGGYGEMG